MVVGVHLSVLVRTLNLYFTFVLRRRSLLHGPQLLNHLAQHQANHPYPVDLPHRHQSGHHHPSFQVAHVRYLGDRRGRGTHPTVTESGRHEFGVLVWCIRVVHPFPVHTLFLRENWELGISRRIICPLNECFIEPHQVLMQTDSGVR